MEMKIIKSVLVVAALVILGAMSLSGVRADEWNKKTVMTFNQPVEIPGQVLPAGTYTFKLLDSPSDRHVVQIFTADGMHIIATVLAINNYRLRPTGQTVVKFSERAGDAPDALKAWFYPGDSFGQEFVYPKARAIELAAATKEPIPALPVEATDLNTAPIVAVTPEQKEVPVTEAIQTTPPVAETSDPAPVAETATPAPVAETTTPAPAAAAQELPKTGSSLPLIALVGFASLGLALAVKRFS
jgi:LPXTG-motif cell wall-anchored protein